MATVAGVIALSVAGTSEPAVALIPAGIGAIYLGGAVHGNRAVNECRDAMNDYEQMMAARGTLGRTPPPVDEDEERPAGPPGLPQRQPPPQPYPQPQPQPQQPYPQQLPPQQQQQPPQQQSQQQQPPQQQQPQQPQPAQQQPQPQQPKPSKKPRPKEQDDEWSDFWREVQ